MAGQARAISAVAAHSVTGDVYVACHALRVREFDLDAVLQRKPALLLVDENPYVALGISNQASLLQAKGDYAAAEPLYRESLAMRRKLLGDEHWLTLNTASNLGSLLRGMGRPEETIALLAPLEPAERRTFTGGNALRLGRFLTHLGRSRGDTGEFEAAEANLTEAHAIVLDAKVARAQDRADVLTSLVELYEAWHAAEPDKGYDVKAAQWRTLLPKDPPSKP